MYIVSVVPITRRAHAETLTYFCPHELKTGARVTVPLRKKEISGIVTECVPLAAARGSVRRVTYGLKKIISSEKEIVYDPYFLSAVEDTARTYMTTTGSLLHSFIIPEIPPVQRPTRQHEKKGDVELYEGSVSFRTQAYAHLIKKTLDEGLSVYIATPEIQSTHVLLGQMTSLFPTTSILRLASDLTAKKEKVCIDTLAEQKTPLIYIGTPHYASLLDDKTGLLVIEHEGSRAWIDRNHPHADMRSTLKTYAHKKGMPLIIADSILRPDTVFETQIESAYPRSALPHQMIDMTTLKGEHILSPQARALITTKKNTHIVLFTVRKGLFPSIMCRDCNTAVACTSCGNAVSIHETGEGRVALCHRCGEKSVPKDICRVCGGFRLIPVGLGTERIKEYIQKETDAPIFILDKESAKTHKGAQKIIKEFLEAPRAILVGTELMLPYLSVVDGVIVISLDTLLALPDVRGTERIMRILALLKDATESPLLIQTHSREYPLFQTLMHRAPRYRQEELALRKTLLYPPFGTIVTWTMPKGREMAHIKKYEDALMRAGAILLPGENKKIYLFRAETLPTTIRTLARETPREIIMRINPLEIFG